MDNMKPTKKEIEIANNCFHQGACESENITMVAQALSDYKMKLAKVAENESNSGQYGVANYIAKSIENYSNKKATMKMHGCCMSPRHVRNMNCICLRTLKRINTGSWRSQYRVAFCMRCGRCGRNKCPFSPWSQENSTH